MVYGKGEIDIKKLNSNTARYFPFAYFLSAKKIWLYSYNLSESRKTGANII